jgi:hypothetical protein
LVRLKVDLNRGLWGTDGLSGEESDCDHPHRDDECRRPGGCRLSYQSGAAGR